MEPHILDIEKAVEECERLGAIAGALSSEPVGETEATLVARKLAL